MLALTKLTPNGKNSIPWTDRRLNEIKQQLVKCSDNRRRQALLQALCHGGQMTLELLRRTGIGKVVGVLRKHPDLNVAFVARALVAEWKTCPGVAAVVAQSQPGKTSAQPRLTSGSSSAGEVAKTARKRFRVTNKSSPKEIARRAQAASRSSGKTVKPKRRAAEVLLKSRSNSFSARANGAVEKSVADVQKQHIRRSDGALAETNVVSRNVQVTKTVGGRRLMIETVTIQQIKYK
eukprot:TRINITY_DN19893_c0_g4_i1.p1 TRINITY_DN19893_c0_g4~~TRINITY_DN19893_c0_g4_i1.p1  ORF type:complete len:249 (+),score=28.94 TRINITY_DN19893_c0_g4_i1:43-747(+)